MLTLKVNLNDSLNICVVDSTVYWSYYVPVLIQHSLLVIILCACAYITVYQSYDVPVHIQHSLLVIILCACAYMAQFTSHIMCLCTVYWSPCHVPVLSMPLVHGSEERGMGMAWLQSDGLKVRVLAEAVGECSSPETAFCADSISVSIPPPCYRSNI